MSISQTFIQAMESLYATPLNGIITFLLLAAIAFIIFKIVRRKRRVKV